MILYLACSDGSIKRWNVGAANTEPVTVGQHASPCKDVATFSVNGMLFLVTGGWDCMVKFFQI
jgi:mRNA export factor